MFTATSNFGGMSYILWYPPALKRLLVKCILDALFHKNKPFIGHDFVAPFLA